MTPTLTYKSEKTVQALAALTQLSGGSIDKYKAAKLMYEFERQMLLRTGTPSINGRLCSIPYGPIVSEVNNGMNSTDIFFPPCEDDPWSNTFQLNGNRLEIINCEKVQRYDLLSDYELELIAEISRKFEGWDFQKLKDYFHDLPEYIETEGCVDISYEYLFSKNGFSKEKVDDLIHELYYEKFRESLI
ncbi:MAG: type II toxin-antitoxin system antitoxin SocA domain-containing protein [Anaerolineaceae bacterium]